MRHRRVATVILLVALLAATGYAAAQLTPVKIGHNAFTDETVFYLGRDAGIFKKHGIHLELIYIPGGSLSVQALIGKSLDMLLAGGTPLVYAVLKGADLKYIAGLNNRMPYVVVARDGSILRTNCAARKSASAASAATPTSLSNSPRPRWD